MARYNADVRAATKNFEQSIGRQERQIKRLEQQVRASSGAIGSQLRGLAGTFAAAFSVQQISSLIDSYTRVQNALRVAGLEGEQLAGVQKELLDLSSRYGVSLESLARLFGNASQSGKELGATQSQILGLTEATSQALLITGTNAQQAGGAILGLSQALASGTVRAEEFNQINEGGLRPLLQAAANAERFGGSVAKLRAAVLDGKVSSQEFFRAILDGSASLEGQASKATLTLSGAFEALQSRLSVYVGEAGQANGATAALSQGILALANNLDTIANVIAVLATVGFGRFVGGALAGGRALQTVSAYASVATTSLAGTALAARAAGTALLAALGGPIGVAAILATGLIYLATQVESVEDKADRLTASADKAEQEADDLAAKLEEAGIKADGLGEAAQGATSGVDALAKSMQDAEKRAAALEKQAGITIVRLAQLDIAQAQSDRQKAQDAIGVSRERSLRAQARFSFGPDPAEQRNQAEQQRVIDQSNRIEAAARRRIALALKAADAGLLGDVPGKPSTPDPDKKKKKPKGRTGPTAEEIAARQAEEIARLGQEELRAKIELTSDVEKRGELERELLRSEYKQRVDDINANKDLSDKQKAAQIAILDRLYGRERAEGEGEEITIAANNSLYAQLQRREEQREALKRQLDRVLQGISAEDALLALQGELATTLDQRREVELRRVELAYQAERAQIQEEISLAELAKDTERLAAARKRMADLEERKPLEVEAARRRNEGPLARYRRGLDDPKTAVEEAVVQKLDAVTDGITDGIADFIGTDDPFIKSLIKILIEQVLIKPITEALSNVPGGGGIGGIFGGIASAIGGLFRATGGPVQKGQFYTVNEGASSGRVEGFVPNTGGKIIPLGQMDLLRSAPAVSQPAIIQIVADEGAAFVPRVQAISGEVTVQTIRAAQPALTNAAVAETRRQFSRPRANG